MNQKEIAKKIIRNFKELQKKPVPTDIDCTGTSLTGFYMRGFYQACRIFGFEIDYPLIEEAIILESGLEMTPLKSPLQQLLEQGLDDEAIKNKTLHIDIEILRRAYDITDE